MIALKIFSHYSIKEAFNQPDSLVQRAKELGYTHLGICDKHSLSGVVEFYKECKKFKIIPIIGATVKVEKDGPEIQLYAQNKNGWLNLIKIIGSTVSEENITFVPLNILKTYLNDIVYIGPIELPTTRIVQEELPILFTFATDYLYQQILLCSKYGKTLNEFSEIESLYPNLINSSLEYNASLDHSDDQSLEGFFTEYALGEKPRLPQLKNIVDPNESLKQLCRDGWKSRKINSKSKELQEIYLNQIKLELDVFKEANIAGYMLIIHDVINYARSKNQQIGLRGSAGGCLVSYLIGLDNMDPIVPDPTIEYDPNKRLLFERFYNKWRNNPGVISFSEKPCIK